MPHEYYRAEFIISTDPARLDLDLLHWYLSTQSYWALGITRPVLERAVANSLCFGLYTGAAQIGFARVITDRATYAYLNDVFVLETYRGRGLGQWLLDSVLAHPDLQDLKRFMLTTRNAQALYNRFGFEALRYPERHLERLPPDYYKA